MVKPDFYAFLRFCKVAKTRINKGDFFRVCKGFEGFAFRRGAPFLPAGAPRLFTLPNVARYQLRHTPKCEKYSIFRSFSVSGQICGQNILSVFF